MAKVRTLTQQPVSGLDGGAGLSERRPEASQTASGQRSRSGLQVSGQRPHLQLQVLGSAANRSPATPPDDRLALQTLASVRQAAPRRRRLIEGGGAMSALFLGCGCPLSNGSIWYLWIFVVIFLLLNVAGWHAYFWIAFVPFFLLLAVGTKLEHVIIQLAHDVAEKHIAIEGDLVVQPSDDHFWFHRPRLVLLLIHIILFQNSFELAFFFWIWIQYSFNSCMMGKIGYVIPRLIIGAFVQFVCSYSTLPLYAIVTQMGTTFKKAIFDEHVQEGLVGWAKSAKKHQAALRKAATNGSSSNGSSQVSHSSKYKLHREEATSVSKTSSATLELAQVGNKESSVHVGEIQPHQLPPANDHV